MVKASIGELGSILRFINKTNSESLHHNPAVVAWFAKALVSHSVDSSPYSANGGSNPALYGVSIVQG